MFQAGPYLFKPADSETEFEQIHALNHATFVREIPQHHDPGDGRLIDKFHEKNFYFVAKRGELKAPLPLTAFPNQHFNGITSWGIDARGEVKHVYA